ncbi:hypothetical protein GSI_12926 [Ganoderma sinense ZZ0214-1]|uniref:Uncharacterized protein n=1 Tax=Ganoderma sinense ZZ0214-1 TaxID=1077348 RepID=A0A2G8RUM3_9APHY|nr:hypothetical protein GSI_12926 [Ganoderma sinense ZZ0214-1]
MPNANSKKFSPLFAGALCQWQVPAGAAFHGIRREFANPRLRMRRDTAPRSPLRPNECASPPPCERKHAPKLLNRRLNTLDTHGAFPHTLGQHALHSACCSVGIVAHGHANLYCGVGSRNGNFLHAPSARAALALCTHNRSPPID